MTTFLIRDLMEESRKLGHRVTQTDLAKAAGVGYTHYHSIGE